MNLTHEQRLLYGQIEWRGPFIDQQGRMWTTFCSVNIVGNNNAWRARTCQDCGTTIVVPL